MIQIIEQNRKLQLYKLAQNNWYKTWDAATNKSSTESLSPSTCTYEPRIYTTFSLWLWNYWCFSINRFAFLLDTILYHCYSYAFLRLESKKNWTQFIIAFLILAVGSRTLFDIDIEPNFRESKTEQTSWLIEIHRSCRRHYWSTLKGVVSIHDDILWQSSIIALGFWNCKFGYFELVKLYNVTCILCHFEAGGFINLGETE